MTRELRDVVKAIIVRLLGVEPHELAPDRLFTDLGADDLDQVEIIMALEDEFGFDISDEDGERITSLGAAIRHVENHGGWVR